MELKMDFWKSRFWVYFLNSVDGVAVASGFFKLPRGNCACDAIAWRKTRSLTCLYNMKISKICNNKDVIENEILGKIWEIN